MEDEDFDFWWVLEEEWGNKLEPAMQKLYHSETGLDGMDGDGCPTQAFESWMAYYTTSVISECEEMGLGIREMAKHADADLNACD